MLIELSCCLNKERLHEINKLKDEMKNIFIKKSLKSEYRYWLIIRLKVIKYKEDFSLLFIFLLLLLD